MTSPCVLVIGWSCATMQVTGSFAVAALGQQLLRRVEVALALQDLAALLRVERRARREVAGQRLPEVVVVAHQGAHVVLLAQRHQHRAPHAHVVEGRVQVVHPEGADVPERVGDVDGHVAVALQRRHQVGDGVLPPVDLAVLERGRGGRRVGHDVPLDAVHAHALGAGKPGAGVGARLVAGEALEGGAGAGHPVAAHEAHGAAAHVLPDLLERVGLRDPLRHDEAAGRAGLAEREAELREGLLQRPAEGPVVHRRQFVLDGGAASAPARRAASSAGWRRPRPWPAPARCRGSAGPRAAEGPGEAVGRDLVRLPPSAAWVRAVSSTP